MSMMLCVVYDGLDGGVSGGDEEDEFNIVERLWICTRREHGGC